MKDIPMELDNKVEHELFKRIKLDLKDSAPGNWYKLKRAIHNELYFELAELWNVIHENDNK